MAVVCSCFISRSLLPNPRAASQGEERSFAYLSRWKSSFHWSVIDGGELRVWTYARDLGVTICRWNWKVTAGSSERDWCLGVTYHLHFQDKKFKYKNKRRRQQAGLLFQLFLTLNVQDIFSVTSGALQTAWGSKREKRTVSNVSSFALDYTP